MKSLKEKAIKSIRWTTAGALIFTAIQFLQNIILARLLEPEDFGIMALVLVVVGLVQPFFDLGLSAAIIQKKEITKLQLSSLYWLNIGMGLLCFIVVYLIAPLIGQFFDQDRLIPFIRLIAVVFLISPWGTQYTALFSKNLRFDLQNIISIIALFFSFLLAVVLAYQGYGVRSMVYAFIFNAFLISILSVFIGRQFNKPTFVFSKSAVSGLVKFGLFATGTRTVNFLSGNIDKILIEKFMGTHYLGLYSIAWNLMALPLKKINPIVNTVIFPLFSKIQDETSRIRKYYTESVILLMIINVPIYLMLAFASEDILFILFGEKWIGASTVLSVLAFVGLLKCFSNPSGALLLSKGRADIGLYWNIFWTFCLFIILLIMVNMQATIEQVAYGQLLAVIVISPVLHFLVIKFGQVGYSKLIKDTILLSLFMIPAYFLFAVIDLGLGFQDWGILIIKTLLMAGFYMLYLHLFFRRYFRLLIQFIK
ncbi:MAG: O-antigen/teichoic acid export membrane protein [Ulvibacter sp.]|jgi:O-antigen/teichoic acid export membrane protein